MTRLAGHFRLSRGSFVLDTAFDSAGPGVTALCGPSGAGKTSLLRCLAGLETPEAGSLSVGGEVWFDAQRGICVPPQQRSIGYVTQEPSLFAHLTVEDNLLYGYERLPEPARRTSLDDVVDGLGLKALLSRRVTNLSGGERQRAWIALALAQETPTLFLDEPTTYLDIGYQLEVLHLVQRLNREQGITVVMVLHDLNHAAAYADRVVCLSRGAVVADGAPAAVVTETLVRELVSGELDVILIALPIVEPEIETLHLFDDKFVLTAPATKGKRAKASDMLAHERLLLLEEGHCLRDQALSFCRQVTPEARETFGASSLSTIVQMVAHGYGITLLPEMAVESEVHRRADIRLVRFPAPEPKREIGLAWRKTSPRKADFHALAALLKGVARRHAKS